MGKARNVTVAVLQAEVEHELGRCILHLQQYEQLMKRIVTQHELSGPADLMTLKGIQAEKAETFADKTLGQVVKALTGSFLSSKSLESAQQKLEEDQPGGYICMRHSAIYADERYDQEVKELAELVDLRNELVHHFVERFDILSEAGCLAAITYLQDCYMQINAHCIKLFERAKGLDNARALMASFMSSAEAEDLLVRGMSNGQVVIWAFTPIVELLRDAERACSRDGWTLLETAKKLINTRDPEQTPKKYGCCSWRQVIHESKEFDVRKEKSDEAAGVRIWYRSKP
jgi:hypothetical protein